MEENKVIEELRLELIDAIQNGTIHISSGNEKLFEIIDKYAKNSCTLASTSEVYTNGYQTGYKDCFEHFVVKGDKKN